ncbi:secreted frizzled-related protein 5 isoform X2 [Podarcis muralis]
MMSPCPWNALGTVLLVLVQGWALSVSQEYDYYSWQSDNFQHGRFYTKQPQCVDIPADLQLCHNVGYKRMRLPNLLEHESMPEVKQQASSWVPLLAKRCHSDTQLFLCSLFAPVCLDRPIYPCRSLCEVVRDSCAPVMESYGFPWPDMLNCNKFPFDNDLCIAVQFGNSQATQPPERQGGATSHLTHPRTQNGPGVGPTMSSCLPPGWIAKRGSIASHGAFHLPGLICQRSAPNARWSTRQMASWSKCVPVTLW